MVNHMDTGATPRLLMKILIAVAWLDGVIQPAERQYLAKVAQTHNLDLDPEIESLLAGRISLAAADCEHWIEEYLGDRSIHDDDGLIEAISGLIYSDGDVAVNEAKLLVNIQSVPSSVPPLVSKIQQLYKKALGFRL